MKLFLTLVTSLFLSLTSLSQNIVRIQDIQGWSGQFQPDSCNDGPNPQYLGTPVTVRGVVITNGGLNESITGTRWIWIRDVTASPSTPFGNITVRNTTITAPVDINSLVSGDTIEVTGQVVEFNGTNAANGETQLTPTYVNLIGDETGPAPEAYSINLNQLNGQLNVNNNPTNNITSGEKLEGNFVQINNVTVVQVQLNGVDRCRLLVKDANDNYIWIYDRFKTQRTTNGFIAPNVGDTYTSIKGIIEGWKNGCSGSAITNRGYNINPFSLTHYVKGASSPTIGSIKKSVACPTPSAPVTISASITDDGSISSVEVLYSIDGTTYNPVLANVIGSRYSAQIPSFPTGTLVRYYIRARDNLNNTTLQPNVPGQIAPMFYSVGNTGCTIRDIQYTPYITGRSGYYGDTVTVEGVVTASAESNNLGFVYIQQEGESAWSGIWVNGGSLISGLVIGNKVSVTGSIDEYFGLTRIINITNVSVVSQGPIQINPIVLNPSLFTTYDFASSEKYESMLVKFQNPNVSLFVVDTNADAVGVCFP